MSAPGNRFATLFAREEAHRRNSWPPASSSDDRTGFSTPPERDLVGLGLSGGGIRSATFNLGLLQGLAELRLLGLFDYLATVSGGGYIGSFLSAWRTRSAGKTANDFPRNGNQGSEPPEIRHLRSFGNFLRPRLQWLSYETGRFVGAVVAGLVPALTAALAVLAAALLGYLGLLWLLTRGTSSGHWWDALPAALGFFALSGAVQFGFEWLWLHERREEPGSLVARAYATVALLASALGASVWWLVWHFLPAPAVRLLTPTTGKELGLVAAGLLAPVAVWLLLVSLMVLGRTMASRSENDLSGRRFLGVFERVGMRFLVAAALWSVATVAWLLGQWVAGEGLGGVGSAIGVAGASGSAFTWLRRLLPGSAATTSGERSAKRRKPWLLTVLAFVTIVALGTVISALLAKISGAGSTGGLLVTALVVAALLAGVLFFFDPHGTSFHSFYRARLVRAYLGATNPGRSQESAECEGDDLTLDQLAAGRPFHLICCTANDLSGDSLKTFHRGAESAVVSRAGLQVGGRWRPWGEGELSVGAAMTASGSAFNSHMGGLSMSLGWPVTFLLTAFNLRLGRWVRGVDTPAAERAKAPILPGRFFFRELLGYSRTGGAWEFLSDGAHFDNLGLYELVRRHCRYILISDCGADPEVAFDDLGNAIRRVREDFGVEIELDTSPLRPGPDRRAERPMVAGEIRYPAGDRGLLLYIKPTLTGTEPSDVAQYAGRNTAFPHETTVDQFFDEAQWESYRRLGEHVAQEAFGSLGAVAERTGKDVVDASLAFAQARITWRPPPRDESGAIEKLRLQWAELEQDLWQDQGARGLLAEVYPPVWQGAARERTRSATPEALVKALPYVRRAIRLFETAQQTTGFGRDPFHAQYRGWRNLAGHWTSSRTVRFWWPWLEPLHSQEFIDFVKRSFDLPGVESLGIEVRELDPPEGFAWERWPRRDEPLAANTRRWGCFLVQHELELLAGIAQVRSDAAGMFTWRKDDIFIAPGLFGVEIRLRFLEELLRVLGAEKIVVACGASPRASDITLYPRAGFRWQSSEGEVCFVRP